MLYFFMVFLLAVIPHSYAISRKAWSCPVPANTTLVPDIDLEVQSGSASYIHGELAQPWPAFQTREGNLRRGFRYCFDNQESKKLLTCQGNLWKAMALWRQALGNGGQESGHSFAWQEANNGDMDTAKYQTYFCYQDMSAIDPALTMIWNEKVPDDTLVICAIKDSSQSMATVGYKGINQGRHPHSLSLGHKASAAVIAHELGHVMGMVHEHTRNDRDQYVRYNCYSLNGYDDALGRAISKGVAPAEAQKKLCEDADFAKEYGFQSAAFLKNDRLSADPNRWGALDEPGGYDIDSIMHYSSYAFGDIDACMQSKDWCPLLQIKKDAQGNEVGTGLIPLPVKPSAGDIAWVKRHYCWPAQGKCQL